MSAQERLAQQFVKEHPGEAAAVLEALAAADLAPTFKRLPVDVAAGLLERLTPAAAARALGALEPERARRLLQAVSPRPASQVLLQLEPEQRAGIVADLPEQTVRLLEELGKHAPNTAGGLMDPRIVTIGAQQSVQQAIASLRQAPRESVVYLYVTDDERRLQGIVTLRDLLLANAKQKVEELVRKDVVSATPETRSDELSEVIRGRRLLALPVVDAAGRLLGVVRHEQLVSAAQEETYEDMQKMMGAGAEEKALSPALTVVKKRLPWLVVNLATAFLAAAVVGAFEGVIAKVTALAIMLPIIAGQGGNTGMQALAVMMRGLALGEVPDGAARRVVLKELLAASVNGLAVGLVTGLAVLLWDGRTLLAAVVCLAMVINMVAAALAGALIPLVLQRLGRDPAQSASIFLTTVTDVVGFAVLLGLALPFLGALTAAG